MVYVYKILDFRYKKVVYTGLCKNVALANLNKIKARRRKGYHLVLTENEKILRIEHSLF